MTAEEARSVCGMFGCIEGREEKYRYPIKMFGTIVTVDSYNLLFDNTADELVFFRLRYIDKFSPRIKGKKMLKLPYKFKKFVHLQGEFNRKKGVADVADDTANRGLPHLSTPTIILGKLT